MPIISSLCRFLRSNLCRPTKFVTTRRQNQLHRLELLPLESRLLLAAGDLDLSFDSDGIALTDFDANSFGEAHDVAIQSDGRIVVAGFSTSGSDEGVNLALARYHPNGLPDSSFNFGGTVTTAFSSSLDDESNVSVAIRSDQKIIVAAGTVGEQFAIARYNHDGSPDLGFGSNGTGQVTSGFVGTVGDMKLLSNDRIIVAGLRGIHQVPAIVVARFEENGTPDPAFGLSGETVTTVSQLRHVKGVALQPDGKIIVVGAAGVATDASDFLIARFNANGAPDTSFGSGGVATTDFGSADIANSVAVQPDGRIFVAGQTLSGTKTQFAVSRYLPNGQFDSSFDADGKLKIPFNLSAAAHDVAVQIDARIVVAGAQFGGDLSDFFTLVRLLPNGSLDPSFDFDGRAVTTFGTGNPRDQGIRGLAIQPDGQIVAAGTTGLANDFTVARYNGDPFGFFHALLAEGRLQLLQHPGTLTSAGDVSVAITDNGDGTIVVHSLNDDVQQVFAATEVFLSLGDGNDTVTYAVKSGQRLGSQFAKVTIATGGGDDRIVIPADISGAPGSGPSVWNARIQTGSGDDVVKLDLTTLENVGTDLQVELGDGADRFSQAIHGNVSGTLAVSIDVQGGIGDDLIEFDLNPGGAAILDPDKRWKMAAPLNITANGGLGQDLVNYRAFRFDFEATSHVLLTGGGGDDEQNASYRDTAFTAFHSIQMEGNDGHDEQWLTYESIKIAQGAGGFEMDQDGGDGDDSLISTYYDVLLEPDAGESVKEDWKASGGLGDDDIAILHDQFTMLRNVEADVSGGDGDDVVVTTFTNSHIGAAHDVAISTGTGNDFLAVFEENVTVSAVNDLEIRTGAGEDQVHMIQTADLSLDAIQDRAETLLEDSAFVALGLQRLELFATQHGIDLQPGAADQATAPVATSNGAIGSTWNINSGAGEDQVSLLFASTKVTADSLAKAQITTSTGSDDIAMLVSDFLAEPGATVDWSLKTGSGDDVVQIATERLLYSDDTDTSWALATGAEDDDIQLSSSDVRAGPDSRVLWAFKTGNGDDASILDISELTVGPDADVNWLWVTGRGDDDVTIIDSVEVQAQGRLSWAFQTGRGADHVDIQSDANLDTTSLFKVNLDTRGDDDQITMNLTQAGSGKLNTYVDTSSGADSFDLAVGISTPVHETAPSHRVILDSGSGDDLAKISYFPTEAAIAATGGSLNSPAARLMSHMVANMGHGDDTLSYSASGLVLDGLRHAARSAGGDDLVRFGVTNTRVQGPIVARFWTGNGDDEIESDIVDTVLNADLTALFHGGRGSDRVALRIDLDPNSEEASVDARIIGSHGGDDLLLALFTPSRFSNNALVHGGRGNDVCTTTDQVRSISCEIGHNYEETLPGVRSIDLFSSGSQGPRR